MEPTEDEAAPTGGELGLHLPSRRLDLAFVALGEVEAGSFVRCLGPIGVTGTPPPSLVERLPDVHWITSDAHPLAYVDPSCHERLHRAWLDSSQGPDRLGRARVRTSEPIEAAGGSADPGWYDAVLIDLIGLDQLDTMVVALVSAPDGELGPADGPAAGQTWLQEGSTFRLQIARGGTIRGASLNVADLLGRPLHTIADTPLADLIHPDDLDDALAAWREVIATPDRSKPSRLRLSHGDGRWRWYEAISWNALDDPQTAAIITEFRDVDEQVAAEEHSRQTNRAHQRLIQVLDEVDDIVMVGRLGHGVVYANEAGANLYNFAIGTPISGLLSTQLQDFSAREIEPFLKRLEPWKGDLEIRLATGAVRTMATTVSPVADEGHDEIYFGVIMRDVTAERSHARALSEQARRDHLTGLPNRLALMEYLEDCRDDGTPVAVCFIDLDNLKIVNDGLGHGAGDRLLIAVADELQSAVGSRLLARFGGDEFVVLQEDIAPQEALAVANDLLDVIQRVHVGGVATHPTASIGVAVSPPGPLDPEGLLRDADAAMYEAKRRGRACVAIFDDALREQATRRFVVETSLRQALAEGGLDVHLQPIVSVDDGRVNAFEALARWGVVSPTEFVATAEESGLILALGDWVLDASLAALDAIQDAHPGACDVRLGVNVSGRQLLDPAYADRTLGMIRDSGIDPQRITLELTESVFIDPRNEVDRALRELRDAGLSLALDDFGSGYSSLSHLRRYPIDVLKLDNSYTQALLHDLDTRIITEAMVTMANRLGLRVVAEGVETAEQLAVVRDLGITSMQGWLVSKALPVEEIIARGLGAMEQVITGLRAPVSGSS